MKITKLSEEIEFRSGFKMVFQAILALSLMMNLLLAIGLAKADRTHRETMVPPVIHKTFWVEDDKVSPEYLEEMGLFITQLALNNSPMSIDYNIEKLLKYAAPQSYGELEKTLKVTAVNMKRDASSTVFSVRGVTPNDKDNSVAFSGMLATYIAEKKTSEVPKAYIIKFGYSAGRVYVIEFRETDVKHPYKEPQSQE